MDPKGEKNGIYLLMEMMKWSWFSGRWLIVFLKTSVLSYQRFMFHFYDWRVIGFGPSGSEFKSNHSRNHTKTRNTIPRFPKNPGSNHKLTNDHKIHTKTIWMAQFVTGLWRSKLKVICLTRKTTGIADPTIPTTPILFLHSYYSC